jgi:hypothetical protein
MELIRPSEMSTLARVTRRNIPEDGILYMKLSNQYRVFLCIDTHNAPVCDLMHGLQPTCSVSESEVALNGVPLLKSGASLARDEVNDRLTDGAEFVSLTLRQSSTLWKSSSTPF